MVWIHKHIIGAEVRFIGQARHQNGFMSVGNALILLLFDGTPGGGWFFEPFRNIFTC